MTPRSRRFDATWLPFGMILGFTVGIGIGLGVIDNLAIGALIGFAVGTALGIALGFRGMGGSASDEDAQDDLYRQRHGDPAPRGAERHDRRPEGPDAPGGDAPDGDAPDGDAPR